MKCDVVRGSHLDLFDRCQLAYRYTVHDGRVPDIKVPRWAMLGWTMHKTFETAIETGADPKKLFIDNLRSYRELARAEWASSYPNVSILDSEIPSVPERDIMRAMDMLRNFNKFRSFIDDADSRETEIAFRIALDQEGTIVLKGRIDLVLRYGDLLKIVDYKSSKPGWEHSSVPPQLLRYAIALAITKDLPISKIETILFNLQSGNVLRRTWSAEEANGLIAQIVRRVEFIRSVHPDRATATVGSHCDTLCQYRHSCPARRAVP